MATTYNTGSTVGNELTTVVVANSTLVGGASFQEEVTDLMADGYRVVGQLIWDGSDYVAFMSKKKWI